MKYEIQPNIEPIEYTHFDTWFSDDEYNNSSNIENDYSKKANEVLEAWEQNLNIKLPRPNFEKEGIEDGFELVIDSLIEQGFSVYSGESFIEIYPKFPEKENIDLYSLACDVVNSADSFTVTELIQLLLEKFTKDELNEFMLNEFDDNEPLKIDNYLIDEQEKTE
jgi:hypothetical protein